MEVLSSGPVPNRVVKLRFHFLARAPACGCVTVVPHEGAWLSEEKSRSWSPTCVCCSGAESARRKQDLSSSHRRASYCPSPAHWTVFLTPSNLGRASTQASRDPLLTSVSVAPRPLHGLQSWFAEDSGSTMHANEQGISTQPFLGRVCILRECPEEGALHKQKKTGDGRSSGFTWTLCEGISLYFEGQIFLVCIPFIPLDGLWKIRSVSWI